jgi:hypothetical protein
MEVIMRTKSKIMIVLILIILIFSINNSVEAKSVFAITKHTDNIIGAYEIIGNQIEYQTQHAAPDPPGSARAVDVEVESESGYIFVTYEFSEVIALVNAKTMTNEGTIDAPGASNLAGLAIEQRDNLVRLFTVDRGSNHLYVYHWDAEEKELTL